MRRFIDSLICMVVTFSMFAFPMILLSLAAWFGDLLIAGLHFQAGKSFLGGIAVMLLVTLSSALVLALCMPTFFAVYWPLARLARYGSRLVEVHEASVRTAGDHRDELLPAGRNSPKPHASGVASQVRRGGGARIHRPATPATRSAHPVHPHS